MQEVLFADVMFDATLAASLVTFIMFLFGRYVYEFGKKDLFVSSLFVFTFTSLVIVCCNYVSGIGMIVWFLFLISVLVLGSAWNKLKD